MMPPLVVVDTYGEISIFDTPEAVCPGDRPCAPGASAP
jgi:hypothetical protein